MTKVLVLVLMLVKGVLLIAAPNDSTSSVADQFQKYIKKSESELSDSLKYYGDLHMIARVKTEIAKEQYFQAQYANYFTDSLDHRKHTFGWQLFSTKLIFITVVLIVLCGLFFSGIQFYNTLKMSRVKVPGGKVSGGQESDTKTEIELSLNNGIKINSSVIGLIILVVSIAFFYLYILYVYPINQLSTDNNNFQNVGQVDDPN